MKRNRQPMIKKIDNNPSLEQETYSTIEEVVYEIMVKEVP